MCNEIFNVTPYVIFSHYMINLDALVTIKLNFIQLQYQFIISLKMYLIVLHSV